ncbi:MAG: type II toxin-antitoxin system VapC family toxin [Phenylobacterium sp.]
MIVVDASAVLAILLREPGFERYADLLTASGGRISPINHWEVLVGALRELGGGGVSEVRGLLVALGIETATLGERDTDAAFEAYRQFGKGNGGPLNLGDCFAYALAQAEGDGLLFKGNDFPKTDVKPAL